MLRKIFANIHWLYLVVLHFWFNFVLFHFKIVRVDQKQAYTHSHSHTIACTQKYTIRSWMAVQADCAIAIILDEILMCTYTDLALWVCVVRFFLSFTLIFVGQCFRCVLLCECACTYTCTPFGCIAKAIASSALLHFIQIFYLKYHTRRTWRPLPQKKQHLLWK